MPMRFVSHKEIAFRQLLGMLRAPPVAVMSYYSNVFQSAKFVLSDQPKKIRFLNKEIRRVECMVGIHDPQSHKKILDELNRLYAEHKKLEHDLMRIESMFDNADPDEQKELVEAYKKVEDAIDKNDARQHFLLSKLQPLYDLKTMETYMDNNLDLKSFFKEYGRVVTQLDVTSELDKVKNWVYDEAVKLMPYIRFTKLE